MFGIRRSNVSYKRNQDSIRNTLISNNQENTDKIEEEEDDQEDIYKSAKFIFYDDNKQFINQIEIYISLVNYYNKKLLVIIASDSSIEQLNNQIVESLRRLRAHKLFAVTNSGHFTIFGLIKRVRYGHGYRYCQMTPERLCYTA